MKKLSLQPVFYFSLLFIMLIGVQSFFLYNTVLLKKSEINSRAKELLKQATKQYGFFDNSNREESLYLIKNPKSKMETESSIKKRLKIYNDSLQGVLTDFVDTQYALSGLRLAYKKELKSIYNNVTKDTVVFDPIVVLETNPAPIQNFLFNESKWEASISSTTSEIDEQNFPIESLKKHSLSKKAESFSVSQATYFDVLNVNVIVFKELWSLFLVSFILMVLMLYLYSESYKKYKQQREQLQLLHNTIDNIAHEFKTPLATLRIATKQFRVLKTNETLDLIDRQVLRLENVLKPLNVADEVAILLQKEHLIAWLQDYKLFYPKVVWNIDFDLTAPFVLNTYEMQTIVNNLVENSLKYGGTKLDVTIVQNQKHLKISVADNGIGIAKKDQNKIFDRFYRVETHNVHNVKGLGLGLHLVQQIVLKHNGKINLVSDLNAGCKITIEI